MTKSFSLFFLALLFETITFAQSISPQSVNSGGTKMTQANGSLSFTVGELVVLTEIDSEGNSLSSGFVSSSSLSTLSIHESDISFLDINVFPNPSSELLNIQINYTAMDQILISINDVQGKEIYKGVYAGISNTIGLNTSAYASGTYILSIKTANHKLLSSYKIIKQ